jgi:hypothetical protein
MAGKKLRGIVVWFTSLSTILLMYLYFRWAQWRGASGFLFGVVLTTVLLTSQKGKAFVSTIESMVLIRRTLK